MAFYYLAQLIHILASILMLLIVVDVILSYFMSPYHPIRRTVDRIVFPMLNPIRKVIPTVANIDFSPLVLLLIVQVLESLLIRIITIY
jgi:YggT family protein